MKDGIQKERLKSRSNAISGFYQQTGRMPSFSEIGEILGLRSKNAVSKLVSRLEEINVLERDKTGRLIPGSIAYPVKILGTVEAGFPSPAEEELADNISLDDMLPIFEGPEESTEALVERNDLKDRVGRCVNQLPEIYRQVIVLHELQGYTYREVAKMLRLPEGTVKSRLNAAFVKLRESLSPHLAEMNPATEVRGL